MAMYGLGPDAIAIIKPQFLNIWFNTIHTEIILILQIKGCMGPYKMHHRNHQKKQSKLFWVPRFVYDMCNVHSTHMYIFGIFYHKTTLRTKNQMCPFFG